ncbi:Nonribosomal peptide synthetase [Metarhizium acridum]|uniref:Nonribosomal peptide synthetase n=1 Tax=Metarhizium acridum TaxID=92637 RepID=UPI001C6C5FDE|nr:Nonribosomal peptide synthetase [Metarhizium acridum]
MDQHCRATMDNIILSELAKGLKLSKQDITPNSTFHQAGGDSITALRVSAACKGQGVSINVSSILNSQTISELLQSAKWLPGHEQDFAPEENTQNVHRVCDRDASALPSLGGAVPDNLASATTNGTNGIHSAHGNPGIVKTHDSQGVQMHQRSSRRADAGVCKMMSLQSSLVLDTRARPGNNVISYFQEYTYSPAQVATLKQAWQQVIRSEPIFRAVFDDETFWDDGIAFFSWSESMHRDERQFEQELESISAPPMLDPATEFKVVTLMGKKSVLVWHVHHALVDGYSAHLLLRKVNTVINGGQISQGYSFDDLARGWQMYQALFQQQATRFWREYLTGMTAVNNHLLLPPPQDQHRDDRPSSGVVTFSAPAQCCLQFAEANEIPLSAVYYAAWALTLSIYTGSDAVLFGVLFANRSLPVPAIRDTVGPMMNTLPLLLCLDRRKTLRDLLHYTAERLSKLREYEWSVPDQRCPMTSVLAMQYDYETNTDPKFQTVSSYTRLQSSIPVNLFLGPKDRIQINYDKNLYDHADIEKLGQMYIHAIGALMESEMVLLDEYFRQPLPPSMWKEIMLYGNCASTHSRGEGEDTLTSLFDTRLESIPDAPAAIRGDSSITYAQLDEAATKVASRLCKAVSPGDVVCVHADRSINWIIAIYAVLKARAVYCPLDPAIPAELRNTYFETSGSGLFLSTWDSCKDKKPQSAPLCYSMEELLHGDTNPSDISALLQRPGASKKDTAYLCFTSGSSGLPKGVACTHEGIVAFQKDYDARLRMRPHLKVAQIMSPAFDGSIHEIFSCLSYGGTILLSETADVLSNLQKADVAMITPSVAKLLNPRDYQNLEAIYMVGEHLPQAVCDAWSAVMPAFNLYGPTESSCGSTCKSLVCGDKVTIGRPVQSTRIYILDQHQFPLPPGAIGELYTAGVQVSPGYIKRPKETARNFLKDTICPETNQTMYRTQDRGYWSQSGEICLLGRSDRQIKLRGFRLDLDDLEIRMVKCSSATSVALARKEDMLVAMIQPETTDVALFEEAIKKVLPPQALPRLIKAVEKFPLGNAGKLDYKAISTAFSLEEAEAPPSDPSASPSIVREDAKNTIASVWRTVLNLDDSQALNEDSSFLELGGHSLEQIALSSRLSSALNTRVTLADVMQNITFGDQVRRFRSPSSNSAHGQLVRGLRPTGQLTGVEGQIEALWRSLLSLDSKYSLNGDSNFIELGGDSILQQKLASRLSIIGGQRIPLLDVIKSPRLGDQLALLSASSVDRQTGVSAPNMGSTLGHSALSPIEQEWLQKYKLGKGSSSFNVNFVCALSEDVDIKRLEQAWNKVLARHGILSSFFPNDHDRVYSKMPPRVILTDKVNIQEEVNREFKLYEELPIRIFLSPTTLVLVASHIVLDLTALNVILSDVQMYWNGKTPDTVPREYGQTSQWSRRVSQDDLDFWGHLSDLPPYCEPTRLDYRGKSRVCKLLPDTFRAMVHLSAKHGITLHQLSLAAVALAIRHGNPDGRSAMLGSPYLNRGVEDFDTVGLFLEPLVIRVQDPWSSEADSIHGSHGREDPWALTFCKKVAAASQQALSHTIPWNELLKEHAVTPDHPNVPFIEAMVTFHDNRGRETLSIDGAQPLYTWCEGAKFKIMFEFLALTNETAMLRMEYDNLLYSETEASYIQSRVIAAIDGLTQELDRAEIKGIMQQAMLRQQHPSDDGSKYFGAKLAEL